MAIEIRHIQKPDIEEFLLTIADADRAEVEALYPGIPLRAVMDESVTEFSYAGRIDGELVCLYGVNTISLGKGFPWMLVTKNMEHHKVTFLKVMHKEFERITKGYHELFNMVHQKNKRAVRWIEMMGFALEDPVEVNGELFLPFWMRDDV